MGKVLSLLPTPSDLRINVIYAIVVPDGYGLAYAIGNGYIRWTITSLKRDTALLKHFLAEAANETCAMMERLQQRKDAKL